jgi:hypothetical protein
MLLAVTASIALLPQATQVASPPTTTAAAVPYVPAPGTWETRAPDEAGFNPARLQAAVEFAQSCASSTPVDIAEYIKASFGHELHSDIVGPTKHRAETNGLLLRSGYLVAEWGDTARPDMTFSVTKTYLSSVVGIASDRGYLRVQDPVAHACKTPEFEGERHARITWDHLLRQTSDWRGTLFGKPAWADRPPRGASEEESKAVPMREPGTSWEYNDVCVNLLAYAAMQVFRRPLPQVLRDEIMDPIGASRTWRWHGYSTSWVPLDGQQMQSVSGGGHHGGGMFVSTRDQARFGLLCLRRGVWGEKRLLSESWIQAARTPTDVRPDYGYMNWFLNAPGVAEDGTATLVWPAAPKSAVMFRGAGSNLVYIDDVNDIVLCLRWVDHRRANEILERLLGALEPQ